MLTAQRFIFKHGIYRCSRLGQPSTMTPDINQRISVKPDSQGRVTIPKWVREYLNLELGESDEVWIQITVHGHEELDATISVKIDGRGRLTIPAHVRRHVGMSEVQGYLDLTVHGLDPRKHPEHGFAVSET